MNCNCIRNGSDRLDFQTLVPGGTAANANFLVGITHFTCGNRKMCLADPSRPVVANLSAAVVGQPQDTGNGTFCCEVLISGTVTYCQVGCCSSRTEYVTMQRCLPCSSGTAPTVTIGNVIASPAPIPNYEGCCPGYLPCTNQIAITTTVNVATA